MTKRDPNPSRGGSLMKSDFGMYYFHGLVMPDIFIVWLATIGCAAAAGSLIAKRVQLQTSPEGYSRFSTPKPSASLEASSSKPVPSFLDFAIAAAKSMVNGIPSFAAYQRQVEEVEARRRIKAINQSPVILLLGPACSGKTTLYRQAIALDSSTDEQPPSNCATPYAPTLGLMRRVLTLPTSRGPSPIVLCDAGGSREQRRLWVELVDGVRVSAICFVLDASDASDEARGLFVQLARAPWSQGSSIFLILTKLDLLPPQDAQAMCATREEAYQAACSRSFDCHRLTTASASCASEVLRAVVDAVSASDSPP